MTKETTFEGLYREQLQDLYDAERQIIDALPAMVLAASSEDLKSAFEDHLEQTKEQLNRLERLMTTVQELPGSRLSEAMRALLSEARMLANEMPPSPVLDAALIAAAQKVEHYEISGYGTACAMAEMLSHGQATELLQQTLQEEEDTDVALSDIAETLIGGEEMEQAIEADEDEALAS